MAFSHLSTGPSYCLCHSINQWEQKNISGSLTFWRGEHIERFRNLKCQSRHMEWLHFRNVKIHFQPIDSSVICYCLVEKGATPNTNSHICSLQLLQENIAQPKVSFSFSELFFVVALTLTLTLWALLFSPTDRNCLCKGKITQRCNSETETRQHTLSSGMG